MQKPDNEFDVCIIGAGVVGASMAAYLGKNGVRVALVERNWSKPDEIIGELLQPDGVRKIQEMGLGEALKDIDAQEIKGYAMFLDQDFQQISYPEIEKGKLPVGYGFRYGSFVQNLRTISKNQGTVTQIEGTVKNLLIENDKISGVIYKNTENKLSEIRASLTVVGQGSLSPLRNDLSKGKLEVKGYMLGMVLEDCELPFENHGHVVMADPAPVLMYPVGSGKVRVLIDFPNDFPALKGEDLKNHLRNHILPQMPPKVHDRFSEAIEKGGFKAKHTCLLPSRPVMKPGVVLVGDSLNMRHPTTGGGMTVAFTDVKRLSDSLINENVWNDSDRLQKVIYDFYSNRNKDNATVNMLAYALYSVFKHKLLSRACFDYLKQGGSFAAEPMSILSGLSRNRWLLIKHFFAVAVFGVFKTGRKNSFSKRISDGYRLLFDSVHIIFPLMMDEIPRISKAK